MNRPRAIGTAAESAVVKFARAHGFPHADRLSLSGAADRGDVRLTTGLTAGVVLEVKAGQQARAAPPGLVAQWREQTATEGLAAGAAMALLVMARTGYGPARCGQWWVSWPWTLLAPRQLLADHARAREDQDDPPPWLAQVLTLEARTTLADALTLLRARGYGDPLTTDHLEDRHP